MGLDLGTLVGHLELDATTFTQGLAAADSALEQTQATGQKTASELLSSFSSLGKAMSQVQQVGAQGKQALDLLNGPAAKLEAVAKQAGVSVEDLRAQLGSMVSAASDAGHDVSGSLGQVADAAEDAADAGEESTGKLKLSFGSLAKFAAGALGGIGVGTILQKGWSRLTGIEDAQAKLRGLGNDAADVKTIMDNALASVKGTAFGMAEAATTAAGAVAAGIKPGEELEGVLKSVANSAAAAGMDMGEMGAIFNQVATTGKAQNDVLSQVAERGVPILQTLAEQLGVTTAEVEEMASAGKIGFSEFESAMKAAGGTVAEEMGTTTSGALDNLGASASRFGAILLEEAFPLAKEVFGALTDGLDAVGKVVGPVLSAVAGLIGSFMDLPGPVKAAVLAFGGFMVLSLTGTFTAIGAAIVGLPGKFKAMAAAAKTAGLTMKTALIGSGVGLAVAAIATALEIFSSRNAEAEARVEAHNEAVHELAGTMDEATGAITGATQAMVTQNFGDVRQDFDALKLSAGEAAVAIVEGAEDGGKSWQEYRDKIVEAIDVTGRLETISTKATGHVDNIARVTGQTAEQVATAMLQGGDAVAKLEQDYIAAGGTAEGFADKVNTVRAEFEYTNPALRVFREETDAMAGAVEVSTKQLETQKEANKAGAEAAEGNTGSTLDLALANAGAAISIAEAGSASADAARQQESAKDAADRLAVATSEYGLAAEVAADKQSELADSTSEVLTELDKLSGRVPTVEESLVKMYEATASMAKQFGVGTDEVTQFSDEMINADGSVNLATESGRELNSSMLDVREGMASAAQAAYDKAIADGDLLGAQDKATAAAALGYEQFIETAGAMGYSRTEADKLAKKYGAMPTTVSTRVKTVDEATPVIDAIKRKITELNGRVATTTVYSNNVETTSYRVVGQAPVASANQSRWMGGSLQGLAAGGSPEGILGIPAPSDPRKDNLLGLARNGFFKFRGDEFITNPRASKVFRPELEAMNAAVPAFASGTPSAGALAGISSRSLGDREGITSGALADLVDRLRDLQDTARDTAGDLRDAKDSYREARAERDQEIAQARYAVGEAEIARRQKLKSIEADIKSAKTSEDRMKALREHHKVNVESTKEINKAKAALAATTAEQRKKVTAEKAEYQSALRASKAASARASEAEDDMRRTARARSLLLSLSRETDRTVKNLESARDRLESLQGSWQSMRESLRGSLSGYGGGITGFSEQRGTAADIIRGLKFNQGQLDVFSGNLAKAKSLGLSADLLQQIAGAGIDGGGVTAKALAGATRAQIAQINQLQKQVVNSADRTGRLVADATYAKAIDAQTAATRKLDARLDRLTSVMSGLGKNIAAEFQALSPQQLNAVIVKAQRELGRRT